MTTKARGALRSEPANDNWRVVPLPEMRAAIAEALRRRRHRLCDIAICGIAHRHNVFPDELLEWLFSAKPRARAPGIKLAVRATAAVRVETKKGYAA
ncbi:MAG: hypothetical protein KF795_17855 [Labilithrix sp.]|nr:hypothetical protein [Labilithrix sp.]